MPSYNIHTPNERYQVVVNNGSVTNASERIDWAIGSSFEHVRSYCERKGWRVAAVIDNEPDVTTFDYKGSRYCLFSNGRNITHITKDNEQISWLDLPDVLKGLL